MRDQRVALAQIAPRLGRVDDNLRTHLDRVQQARTEGADRIVFPELSLTGYHLLDQTPEVALALDDPPLRRLADAADDLEVVLGMVERSRDHRLYNSAVVLRDGAVRHVHRKLYLPTYGMFQEGREFAAGGYLRTDDSPLGRTGILICEDLWHPSLAWLLAQDGAEILIGLSNGPTRGARESAGITSLAVWRDLLRVSAQFQTCYAIYVNRVGCEDGLVFGGGSLVVDPFGRIVAECPALEEDLQFVDLPAAPLRRARTAYPMLRDERIQLVRRELERIAERRDAPPSLAEATEETP